ncbi:NADPH-dependent glutamate synthase [Clostridium cellulovorans]|uniref:Glutamate synthase (NADPH), homotetrameric n=1 Tax=Clostridium cellulovorans (strain ATCC 35296 / DSM 3052 / OCM 3 / 743B) TaxID=573061 RepID=D9ST01_CLOC7|nr:NADPH-dependent glutamate synthase [Clostridium cellulovorans]ADL52663.1 glutamate synthase (NADPH), homotetrameric [Clostridium cellulovorans 743B]
MDRFKRTPAREEKLEDRITNFNEVCTGYDEDSALTEASRCLNCKNPKCKANCPVNMSIPDFIASIKEKNYEEAARIIDKHSALSAICSRVCPQEKQCEGNCVLGIKGESISIGNLERFVSDWARENNCEFLDKEEANGKKVAVIGSGPAGLTCARDLAKLGYEVTIFESMDVPGGILMHGIPEFRLPKKTIVKHEIEKVQRVGVKIETGVTIGRDFTLDSLLNEKGFDAIFIGAGAGISKEMRIPGENANGVYPGIDLLSSVNTNGGHSPLLKAGERLAVIGGGNVAMDVARVAIRLGAKVQVVYRRSEEELPAREVEIEHTKAEGAEFNFLTNPIEVLTDEEGKVTGMRCVKMALGEPDESGRRRPVVVEGSEFVMEVDKVAMALGSDPSTEVMEATNGVERTKWNSIIIDEETGRTSNEKIFAGGDIVTGAETVIKAMSAGRKAAKAIDEYLKTI